MVTESLNMFKVSPCSSTFWWYSSNF